MDAKERKNLLVFGYGLAIIITFIVGRLAFKHHALTAGKVVALVMAMLLALVTLLRLEAIRPVYHLWMKGARFIGEIVTFVLLTAIFYILFAPLGLILKLIRKDLLDEKMNQDVVSYWKDTGSKGFDRDSLNRQF